MKLQLTNGYHVHFDQISRILQYLLTAGGRKKIPRQKIVATMGLSERQVENLISVSVGFGLVKSRTSILTPLGKIIAEKDSYFERIETLWIIHYIISSHPEWVVWYRIVNQIIPMNEHIVISEVALPYFSDLKSSFSERTLKEKLPGEIGPFFDPTFNHLSPDLTCYVRNKQGSIIRIHLWIFHHWLFYISCFTSGECTLFLQAPYPLKRLKRGRTAPAWF